MENVVKFSGRILNVRTASSGNIAIKTDAHSNEVFVHPQIFGSRCPFSAHQLDIIKGTITWAW